MVVNSTDMQNNFGKYLKLCEFEDVIVSRNGKNIAKLVKYDGEWNIDFYGEGVIREKIIKYEDDVKKVSYEDFLEIVKASEYRYELIDGKLIRMESPTVTHQKIQSGLLRIFSNWFYKKNCIPLISPFDITLQKPEKDKSVVQPDLMVICDLEEMTDERDRYTGIPALVLEILSQSTKSRDFVLKMDLYMNSGVKEYWIVNPFNRTISVYVFKDFEIADAHVWKVNESAESDIFKGLVVKLEDIL